MRSRQQRAPSKPAGLCATFALPRGPLWATVAWCWVAVARLTTVALEQSAEELEAVWRLGFWWNNTWCALRDPRNFSTSPFAIPHDSVLVLPDGALGEVVLPVRGRRYNKERMPLVKNVLPHIIERINSYHVWRYAADAFGPDWLRSSGLDFIAVTALDGSGPSKLLPMAAHCRGAVYRLRNGIVMWPGLRQSTENYQQHMADARAVDVPWERKTARAVWRGGTSGDVSKQADGRGEQHSSTRPLTASRMDMVRAFRNDSLFDVAFSSTNNGQRQHAEMLRPLLGDPMTQEEQLRYKIIVSVDGNTCSSVLTWAFATNSVVAMVHPLAYEAPVQYGLEPWVHFIPFSRNFSDLRKNVRWCFAHDAECGEIAARAQVHVGRLLLPDHERWVQTAMLRRIRDNKRDCLNPADAR